MLIAQKTLFLFDEVQSDEALDLVREQDSYCSSDIVV